MLNNVHNRDDEGKNRPQELGDPELNENRGKNTCLYMCRYSFNSAHYVILDSGFCVLKALVELIRTGDFAAVFQEAMGLANLCSRECYGEMIYRQDNGFC